MSSFSVLKKSFGVKVIFILIFLSWKTIDGIFFNLFVLDKNFFLLQLIEDNLYSTLCSWQIFSFK